jgi:hypothetical protein
MRKSQCEKPTEIHSRQEPRKSACQISPFGPSSLEMDESVDQFDAPAAMDRGQSSVPSQGLPGATLISFPLRKQASPVRFDRRELTAILDLYGRHVARGEWRDYGLNFGKEAAEFAVYRRASEQPLYRIVKAPGLARKQGAFAVFAQGGEILKRGHDLLQVLRVLAIKEASA